MRCLPHLLLLAAGVQAADLLQWNRDLVRGTDFDFEVALPSGRTLKTTDDPSKIHVLSPDDIPTLDDPIPDVTMTGRNDAALSKRYMSFGAMWYVPDSGSKDTVEFGIPWFILNQTVDEDRKLVNANPSTNLWVPDMSGGEVQNGTIHVWEYTEELEMWFLESGVIVGSDDDELLYDKVEDAWSDPKAKLPKGFAKANVEFKVQNTKGKKRCDVNGMGAPIKGVKRGDRKNCKKSAVAGSRKGPTPLDEDADKKDKGKKSGAMKDSSMKNNDDDDDDRNFEGLSGKKCNRKNKGKKGGSSCKGAGFAMRASWWLSASSFVMSLSILFA